MGKMFSIFEQVIGQKQFNLKENDSLNPKSLNQKNPAIQKNFPFF